MNCRNCGTMLSSTHKFCLNCGTPVENNNAVAVNADNFVEQSAQVNEVVTEVQNQVQPAPTVSIFETTTESTSTVEASPIVDNGVSPVSTPVMEVVVEQPIVVENPVQEAVIPKPVVMPEVQQSVEISSVVPSVQEAVVMEPVVVPEAQQLVEVPVVEMPVKEEVAQPLSGSNPIVPDTLVQPEVQPIIPEAPVSQPEVVKVEIPIAEIGNKELPVSVPTPVVETAKPVSEPVTPVATKTTSEPEQKGDGKAVYAVIGFLIVLVICGTILFLALREPKEESSSNNNNSNQQQEETVPMNNFKIGKFTYHIPARYTSSIREQDIDVSNSNYFMTFRTLSGVDFTEWSDLDGQAVVAENGYTVIRSETKTYNGKKYLVVRALVNKIDGLFVFSKSTVNYGIMAYGFATNYVYDENLETELISIMEKVEYNETANTNIGTEMEVFDIIEKKAK